MAHRLRRVSLLTLPAFLIKLQMKSGVVETAWLLRVNGTHSFAEPGAGTAKPLILALTPEGLPAPAVYAGRLELWMSEERAGWENTTVARLSTDLAAARRIADVVAECLALDDLAASIFEEAEGRWTLALHFRDSPDEEALREVIAAAAGAEAAAAMVLETLAPSDWVRRASRASPRCTPAVSWCTARMTGRGVAANRIAVEIEARSPSAPATTAAPADA